MISFKKLLVVTAAAVASLQMAGTAQATVYTFDVLYSGGGSASLASGSDNPVGTFLNVGDSFNYSLSAQSGMQWRTTSSGYYGLLDALLVYWNESRSGTYSFGLSKGGVDQYSASGSSSTCCAHIGGGLGYLNGDLAFDKLSLSYTLDSASGSTQLQSMLPFFGAPENHPFNPIVYETATAVSGAVPEVATWAMMIAGFGLIGVALRRRTMVSAGYAA